ncbi:MAG: DNA-directed RNA polymerase subunit B'' [Euryarchaeota archaeon]|nr:DNA-directed RNA polymerase subunit B'' [Euryarchaeota archaeon]
MLDRKKLSSAYFTKNKIVQHQIDSFNEFIDHGLQKVVDEMGFIETEVGDASSGTKTYVRLETVSVGHPVVKEADGAVDRLFPSDARLRNLTYSAPINLTMTVVQDGVESDPRSVEIGVTPIMLHSKACNLYGLTDAEIQSHGEDPLDPGGYFITNGTERVIMTLEDLAPNKIMTEIDHRYGDQVEIAKVFSERYGYRALTVVERGRKSILEVSFPSLPGRINFVVLVRALGLETDKDLVDAVSDDPDIREFMKENLEEAVNLGVFTQENALEELGSVVATRQAREYQTRRIGYVLDRYLLPHLGNEEADRMVKSHYLARMAEACFELAIGRRNVDDKDHYASKRLKLAGNLMEDLFRVSFNRLARDIKYQIERASMRKRELNIMTVIRPDVLTQRIVYPLATGNWVGGRTGVAQLLDRTDQISSLSHLRRVISPLSRTQPHFEARDLHPTQWGRLCPSETPEGPNCGLVKNFAQMVELSTGIEDTETIKNELYAYGVTAV